MSDDPKCWMDEDGRHFWWQHQCSLPDMSHLDADTQQWYREQRAAPHMLPLGPDGWQVVQSEPLTITPSLLCGNCGAHGFFTGGRWIGV